MSVSYRSYTSAARNFYDEAAEQSESIAELLPWAAQIHPSSGIRIVVPEHDEATFVPYPALLHEALCILGGLRSRGHLPGTKIVLLLTEARDFLPAWWACLLGGYIPCPLAAARNDPARWARHLAHVDRLLDQPLLVTRGSLTEDVPLRRVVDLDVLRTGTRANQLHQARGEDAAILMLTSGSTGDSKAVTLTHHNLLAAMAGKARRQAVTAADIALNWISFDHVAALLEVHLIALYAGATQLHVDPTAILADPLCLLRLIDRHRVSLTFSPNFLLGQINATLQSGTAGFDESLDLSCVRHIISGGEANVVATGQRFLQRLSCYGLPHTALRPAFGMTETCAGSIYSDAFPGCDIDQEFASVGEPLDGLQMRIVEEDGAVARTARVGELQLRGPMIFAGYYNDRESTRAAFTPDGWFRTGDLGRIDDGRLTLVGRNKDSLVVSGVNYFSHELETALEPLEGIERSFIAAFPTRRKGADTEQLVVTFATGFPLEDEARLHRLSVAVRNTTLALWGFRPELVIALPKGSFPKTSLGKIQRSLLRKRLEAGELWRHIEYLSRVMARQLGPHVAPEGPAESSVAEVYAEVLRIDSPSVGATANFFDLGGTSLDIFKLKRALEQRFALADLPVAAILQNSTVRELAAHLTGTSGVWGAARYNPLVPLQVTGSKTPLFCIHPGTGEVLVFVSLANYFTNDRPVYALRARGFNSGENPFGTFEEMVTTYVQTIRKRQPHGPYALAGYSFGAPVAFEIAKALEAQGERVAFLGCLDGAPYIGNPAEPLDFIGSTVVVAFFLGLIDKEQMQTLPGRIRAAGLDPCTHIMQLAPARRFADLNLNLARFKAWANLAYSLVRIGEAYRPSGTVESATVFYAEPLQGTKQEWLGKHLEQWDSFTRRSNRYVEVPGEHNSLLGPRNIAAFQAALRAEIRRALPE
jgi:acyl-CoA synthetase (AMP-forming)/AMP-acid ligase II/thioesterase domain-containing protein/acyl carrier protein